MQRSNSDPTFVSAQHLFTSVAATAAKVAAEQSFHTNDNKKNDSSATTDSNHQSDSLQSNSDSDSVSDSLQSTENNANSDHHRRNAYTLSLEGRLKRIKENNSWNSEIENIVKTIGEQAAGYQWMHLQAADFLGKVSTYLTILYIVVNSLAGVILSTTLIAQLVEPWIYIPVGISAVINIVLTILAAAIKMLDLEDRVAKHKTAMSNFSYLYFDTRKELSFYRRNRKYGPQYLDLVAQRFDFYVLAGPEIPGRIVRKYRKILKKEGKRLAEVGKMSHEITVQKDKKRRSRRRKRRRGKKSTSIEKEEDKTTTIEDIHRANETESESECDSEPNNNNNNANQFPEQQYRRRPFPSTDRYTRFQIDRFTSGF